MKAPYFELGDVKIFNDDFLTTECVEPETIDLIVTSPPYNVDIKYSTYNDQIPYEVYLEFTEKWQK
jgi:site-specific DNA-methyltransferase (adenine-specific)